VRYNKGFLYGMLVLVIFFIIVVLAIATSAPKGKESLPAPTVAPTTEPISLCIPFLKNPAKLSCQKAAEVALADTKGKITNIAIGPLQINPGLQKTLKISNQQVWLIDIYLEKPFTAPNKKQVKSLRIAIPLDNAKIIGRIVIKS